MAFFRTSPVPPVFANQVRVDRPFPYHEHDFTELAIILEGESRHRIGEVLYDVQVGDVYVLHQHVPNAFVAPRGLVVGNVMFDRERLAFPEAELRRIPGYRSFMELEP
ncbi:MAG: AraC family ligand binding domain-containing protein, partial [Kiritimatiellae bacterium]|nr:AraC family ligand binding domain-containing protein [Kiritimatiellia bacterium]